MGESSENIEPATFNAPAYIGGIPTGFDFVPSIVITSLFASLYIVFLYRQIFPETRTLQILFNTACATFDRVFGFSLRAVYCRKYSFEGSMKGELTYWQISYSLSYIGLIADQIQFLRVLLVNTTIPDEDRGIPDQPRKRFWYRRVSDIGGCIWLASVVPAVFAALNYGEATYRPKAAKDVFFFRYLSGAIFTILHFLWLCVLVAVRIKIPSVDRRGLNWLFVITLVLVPIPIYRFCVLHEYVTVTVPPSPGADVFLARQSTPRHKTLFYIFQILPEFLGTAVYMVGNVRKMFNCGPAGDYTGNDDKGIPRPRKDGVLVEKPRLVQVQAEQDLPYDGLTGSKPPTDDPLIQVVENPFKKFTSLCITEKLTNAFPNRNEKV